MTVASTDIKFKLSGGVSNPSAILSLGGVRSSVDAPVGLFDRVEPEESTAGDIEYRIIYIYNANASEPLVNPVVWLSANTPNAASIIDICVGTSVVNGIEEILPAENGPSPGVTYSAPASKSTGLALGNIPALGHRAVRVRRTVGAGAAGTASDTYKIKVEGE